MKLASNLKPETYRPIFQKFGRMHVPDFLEPQAAAWMAQRLGEFDRWSRLITVGHGEEQHPALRPEIMAQQGVESIQRVVTPPRQSNIEFLFDSHSIATVRPKPGRTDDRLKPIGDFINGPGFLDFVRRLTGDARILRCDVSATRYLPGHYLTPHNDANTGEERLYAYVLNLGPEWRVEWGGVLAFIDQDGHVAEGYTPVFNALNVFRVPQNHTVTMVTSLARSPRLAITGWMHGSGSFQSWT